MCRLLLWLSDFVSSAREEIFVFKFDAGDLRSHLVCLSLASKTLLVICNKKRKIM